MGDKFSGPCPDGPYKGQLLEHWSTVYRLRKPVVAPRWPWDPSVEVVTALAGQYVWNAEFKYWQWEETK